MPTGRDRGDHNMGGRWMVESVAFEGRKTASRFFARRPDARRMGRPGRGRSSLRRRWFARHGHEACLEFRFDSVETALGVFASAAGPFVQFIENAAALERGEEALGELRAALVESNQADDGTCRLPAPYLLAVARR